MSDDHTTFHPESWLERPEVVEADLFDSETLRTAPAVDRMVDRLLAYALVGAELARLLRLFVDASDPMEATDDALVVLDRWHALEAAAFDEAVRT